MPNQLAHLLDDRLVDRRLRSEVHSSDDAAHYRTTLVASPRTPTPPVGARFPDVEVHDDMQNPGAQQSAPGDRPSRRDTADTISCTR
jgi:hypothetical protein